MSTKNLARTAIEGGRHRYSQFERRHSHRVERAKEREALAHLRLDDDALETFAIPRRTSVGRGFSDKLGPVERWLASHANRPFRKVHQEMFERFDVRTLAARHVVFDHLLPGRFVREDGRWTVHRRVEFWVDRHGLLRAVRPNLKAARRPWHDAYDFSNGRRVRRDPVLGFVWVEHRWVVAPSIARVAVEPYRLTPDEIRALLALTPEARSIVLLE